MGGTAFLMYGDLDIDVFSAIPVRTGFFNRLLGRKHGDLIKSLTVGRPGTLVDLPSDSLAGIPAAFRDFLHERFSSPKPRDSAVLNDYFLQDVISVFLRGERQSEKTTQYYVQIGFSGCAGLAETSAELGAHWAEIWYQERSEFLMRRFFDPIGFTPTTEESTYRRGQLFAPAGDHGYALFITAVGTGGPYGAEDLYPPFEIDAAIEEQIGQEKTGELLAQIKSEYMPLLADGKCRCGMCAQRPPTA